MLMINDLQKSTKAPPLFSGAAPCRPLTMQSQKVRYESAGEASMVRIPIPGEL